jgi:hypothetical protein
MVSQYGGTFGHRALNIRVVVAKTGSNLTLPKAMLRSLIKQVLGLFSLGFMFFTKKAQSLHDLAAGSEVRIRNSQHASRTDYFVPEQLPAGVTVPSAGRRIVAILIYSLAALLLVSVIEAFSVSPACINNQNLCNDTERETTNLLSLIVLVAVVSLTGFGWTGRLPGCRRQTTQDPKSAKISF